MLADPAVRARGDAEGGLQLAPDGERRRDRRRQGDGERRISARAPDWLLLAPGDPHDRVVAGELDRPVVGEEGVGEVAEAGLGLASAVQIGSSERLPDVATIACGGSSTASGTGVSNSSWSAE